jgi:hypothetical protein
MPCELVFPSSASPYLSSLGFLTDLYNSGRAILLGESKDLKGVLVTSEKLE